MEPEIEPINLSQDILKRRLPDGVTVEELFRRFSEEMRIAHAQYYAIGFDGGQIPVSIGTFKKEWLDYYITGLHFLDDPVIQRTAESNSPFLWNTMTGLNEKQAALGEVTRRLMGPNGMTVPLGTAGVTAGLSMTSWEPEEEWIARLPSVAWNATLVGQKIHAIVMAEKKATEAGLTPLTRSQKKCLRLLATGLGLDGICEAVSMTEKEVVRVLDNAQARLKARTHTHALVKAVTLGFMRL